MAIINPDPERIAFRRATMDDISLFHRWLHEPHVYEWWGDDAGTLEEVTRKYTPVIRGEDPAHPFVILHGERPIGYIQAYLVDDEPEYAAALAVEPGAAGVDLYIGEREFAYRGLGPRVLRRFLRQIVFGKLGADNCLIDPAISNRAAIRAYEKAGFRWIKTVNVPGEAEPTYLMWLTAAELRALEGDDADMGRNS